MATHHNARGAQKPAEALSPVSATVVAESVNGALEAFEKASEASTPSVLPDVSPAAEQVQAASSAQQEPAVKAKKERKLARDKFTDAKGNFDADTYSAANIQAIAAEMIELYRKLEKFNITSERQNGFRAVADFCDKKFNKVQTPLAVQVEVLDSDLATALAGLK
jgi:hypothetical protein